MPEYGFQCSKCQTQLTLSLSPSLGDDLEEQPCQCGGQAKRVFDVPQVGYIDFVNPNHGDGLNMGLPIRRDTHGHVINFKSANEREEYAKRNGFEKLAR